MAETMEVKDDTRLRFRTGIASGWRWLAWGTFALYWTASLLTTEPLQVRDQVLPTEAHYSTGKLLHVFAYATFALLTGWLKLSANGRRGILLVVIVHAMMSEYLQQYVGRTSAWADVALDLTGIALGVAFTWKRWGARQRSRSC